MKEKPGDENASDASRRPYDSSSAFSGPLLVSRPFHNACDKVYEDFVTLGMSRRIQCPICSSGRGRGTLLIRETSGRWKCFRCENRGGIADLRRLAGDGSHSVRDLVRGVASRQPATPEPERTQAILPPFPAIRPGDREGEYLASRGIPQETIVLRGMARGLERYNGRAVLPCRRPGNLTWAWFQARAIGPARVRYTGPATGEFAGLETDPRSVLYGEELLADGMPMIIVCEGPLSAARVGPDAVATLRKNWHPAQAAKIAARRPRSVLVAFDRDPRLQDQGKTEGIEDGISLARELARLGLQNVFVVRIQAASVKAEDAGDLGRERLLDLPRAQIKAAPKRLFLPGRQHQ